MEVCAVVMFVLWFGLCYVGYLSAAHFCCCAAAISSYIPHSVPFLQHSNTALQQYYTAIQRLPSSTTISNYQTNARDGTYHHSCYRVRAHIVTNPRSAPRTFSVCFVPVVGSTICPACRPLVQ